ncbi:nicotinamide phosphoribosyltransferase-like isoform X1 [Panulirus ornatus]|uniref:nicotinamide phosphoribosyltransferase-like isoform X1 n=2 Tax=Panulirus ornatus TaxID=150431 RepID=UPI003A8602CB
MEGTVLDNVILLADSYKVSHHRQYPPGTSSVYSYFESRGGRFPYTVFFGLQYILKRWLKGPVLTKEMIQEAKEIFAVHFKKENVFNEDGWNYILEHHGGKLPLRVCAVPEGTVVPTRNVLFTVESTDPMVPWVTNYFETIFVQTWYPMTVATNSRIQKQIIRQYLEDTHDSLDPLPFSLHDFGYRGASSVESAAIGGAAHLVNFKGTDTVAALSLLRKYYHSPMAGFSIPASEHSTVTAWGRDGETSAFRTLLEAFPDGPVACVSDSYDIWKCCEKIWGEELRDLVIKRGKTGGVLCIRPDSGDPPTVVHKCLEILGSAYGTRENSKGFRLLPPYIKVIQGDGISYRTIGAILENLKAHGWSSANVVFGSGGSLLQKVNRDTQKCAFKCSYVVINGEGVDVYKQPISDLGKTSKKGRLALHHVNGTYTTVEGGTRDPKLDVLVPVFENGELLKDYTLEEIRGRAELNEDDIDVFKFLAEEES